MPMVLTGNPTNVTTPLVSLVTALSNNGSGAVRVQTGAAHLYGSNDSVTVNAPPVIGTFLITVIDASHFDLIGSTFTSTGTGTATDNSLTPQIQVPVDGDTASLQLSGLLSSQQATLDRTQFIQREVTTNSNSYNALSDSARVRNWQTPIAWALSAGPYLIHWNDSLGSQVTGLRWIVCGWLGSGPVITALAFDGQGGAGTNVGTGAASATPPTGITSDFSGNIWIAAPATIGATANSNGLTVSELPVGTSVFTQYSGTLGGGAVVTSAKLASILNTVMCAVGTNNNLSSLGVIVPFSGYAPHLTGLTAPFWILRSNGTYVLAIAANTGSGCIPYKSTNGTSWTAGTASMGGAIGSTDVVIDAAWNSYLSLWLMAVSVGGANTTTFYSSPDGFNWVNTGATLHTPYQGSSLSFVGRTWVYLGVSPATAPTNSSRVMYSSDGLTWYASQGLMTPSVANAPMIRCSPTQIGIAACLPSTDTTDTTEIRFSLDVGVPDTVVS